MQRDNKFKIFIVGHIPEEINNIVVKRFQNAEQMLSIYGVRIVNPLDFFMNEKLSKEQAYKKSILELTDSNAVFLLNENNNFYKNSLELKLAFVLNITIIHQPLELYEKLKMNKVTVDPPTPK